MTTRVLQIIPTLVRGGAEKQMVLLATGLARDEYEVSVCALTSGGPYQRILEDHGIAVEVIGKKWKADPAAYFRLRRHIRHLNPDIVHTWIFAANCYGRQAAFSLGVPNVIAGERCEDRWKSGMHLTVDRLLARRTRAIVVPSSGVRDFYVAHGVSPDLFCIIPNGIRVAEARSPMSRDAFLRELDLPENARVIGAVGRLWPQKRWKDAIWAAEVLSTARPDVHLVIIGDGPQRWRLERYRDQVHLDGRVHLVGHRDDVPRLMQHFDCLWLTSAYEGLPNSILEAMANGLPVLATDIPGNRDVVSHGETGFLIPLGNRAEFAQRTHELLEDATLRHHMGQAGRQRVLDHFTADLMIERHQRLYESALSGEIGSA